MTATTKKPLACDIGNDADRSDTVTFNRPNPWRSDRDYLGAKKADIKPPMPNTPMPTADDYAEGMKKLRAKANCPVLSPEETLLAQEFATYPDLDVEAPVMPHDWAAEQLRAAKKRKSVSEYLKEQHREDMLRRMPKFEQWTHDELRELRAEVARLGLNLMVTNLIIVAAVVIGGVAWLL